MTSRSALRQIARVATYQQAERQTDVDFPIACAGCLGVDASNVSTSSANLRMLKGEMKACHGCKKPFVVFQWRVNAGAQGSRLKTTVICQECATKGGKSDGRGSVGMSGSGASDSTALIAYTTNKKDGHELSTNTATKGTNEEEEGGEQGEPVAEDARAVCQVCLERLVDANKRALTQQGSYTASGLLVRKHGAPICSFFAKGKCTRGLECPFRHVPPTEGGSGSGGGGGGGAPKPPRPRQSIETRIAGVQKTLSDEAKAERKQRAAEAKESREAAKKAEKGSKSNDEGDRKRQRDGADEQPAASWMGGY